MRIMRILTLILLISTSVVAHNPLIASFTISQQNGIWMLDINLAQVGAHEAMKVHYTNLNLDEMGEKEYKELMVAYIKKTCKMKFNGKEVALGEGGIKLGNHETSLRFVLKGIEEIPNSMELKVLCFSENEGQQNIVSLIQQGHKQKHIAEAGNDYTIYLFAAEDGNLVEK